MKQANGSTNVAYPKGSQGAPKASGNAFPIGNKVSVSTPKAYCTKTDNDGYLKNAYYPK